MPVGLLYPVLRRKPLRRILPAGPPANLEAPYLRGRCREVGADPPVEREGLLEGRGLARLTLGRLEGPLEDRGLAWLTLGRLEGPLGRLTLPELESLLPGRLTLGPVRAVAGRVGRTEVGRTEEALGLG